jgi:hypothetical protein
VLLKLQEAVMNKSSWITYKGKNIRFTDFSGLKGEEFVSAIHDSTTLDSLEFSGLNNTLSPVLIDYTGSVISSDAAQALRASGAKTTKCVSKIAVIGITGVKQVLLNIANRITGNKMTAFDKKEDALEWLIK